MKLQERQEKKGNNEYRTSNLELRIKLLTLAHLINIQSTIFSPAILLEYKYKFTYDLVFVTINRCHFALKGVL